MAKEDNAQLGPLLGEAARSNARTTGPPQKHRCAPTFARPIAYTRAAAALFT